VNAGQAREQRLRSGDGPDVIIATSFFLSTKRLPEVHAAPMRLNEIKLAGFKSFVDPTSIQVPGQLVGIVGPNGCGKSNVMDAVRWVLGESRAAALRGDSMMDVLFNGSANRKPTARASVELVFDNAQGRAAGQWSQYAELSVKRVLQRDGDSSYFINNAHVRRRDITDVFLGTGLGPRAYAIIEQGMISRVIEAKPEDLRIFLEEAAGVSKYRERRRETEHRLSDTRENLARVSDIRAELGAQIDKLATQAEVASRYIAFQEQLQFRQQLLWYVRRRDAEADARRCAAELGKADNALEEETSRLREVEARVESARSAHYIAGDALNASQAALYGANTEVARHESELRHVEETRQRLETQHTERRAQLHAWREQRAQLTQALHMWVARSGSAHAKVAATAQAVAAESRRLPEAEQAFRAAQDAMNQARSQLMQAESRQQLEQANRSHLEKELSALAQRRARIEAEFASLSVPDRQALREFELHAGELDAGLLGAEQVLGDAQRQAAEAEQALALAQEQLAAALRESTAAEARLATLRQIQAAAEDNAPLRAWHERHALTSSAHFWQKLRIEQGWETAVEAVLRERLHALALEDLARLGAIVADPPPVRASFFAPAGRPEAAEQMHAGRAPLLSKVQIMDAVAAGAARDWFAGIYALDGELSEADKYALPAGVVLVDREGRQFTRHTATLHAQDPADAGLLARQAEIEQLAPACDDLISRTGRAQHEAEGMVRMLAGRQGNVETLRLEQSSLQKKRHEVQIEILKLRQALERYQERSVQLQGELREIAGAVATATGRNAESDAAIERHGQAIEAARAALDERRAAHVACEERLAAQRLAQQAGERAAQAALFEEKECTSKIAEIDRSVVVIDQQIARAETEIQKLTLELADDPVPALRAALESAVETRIACEKTLAGAREVVESAAGALRTIEEARIEIEGRIAPLRERSGELKLKEQAAQINRDQLAAQLDAANADMARLQREAEDAPRPSALQAELTRLGQSISELGAVNLAALEELKSSSERKAYLDAQAGDLDEAVKTLEDAIRRIDRETRQLLRDTFESVNRHFGSLFPALFGGGEAKLILTGEEILDAGIQVMAQPPGKRNSTIHLLSGGEKALTAIALVFSLFQLNPAPFCLLDEVDAPLDDSNTVRFTDLVRKMSQQTQFLFISHNKITMELAEQLVGVTMPESGVSRVVAVDIEQALRIREELAA